jgi:hypothetical protein
MLETTLSLEIVEVNLKTAAGLPGAEGLDIPRYLERLDACAKLVGAGTEAALPIFHRCPAEFDDSMGKFRMLALVTVLQRDLGVRYDPACQQKQNLSPPEELAAFLRERGQCWLEHLRTRPAPESFAQAARLNPRLPRIDCALAIGRLLHRAVEQWGRETLFALRAAELRLPPPENPWDVQVRPLALQELRRIVTNYRQRRPDSLMRSQTVYCHP